MDMELLEPGSILRNQDFTCVVNTETLSILESNEVIEDQGRLGKNLNLNLHMNLNMERAGENQGVTRNELRNPRPSFRNGVH
jgi:hypothetical protein